MLLRGEQGRHVMRTCDACMYYILLICTLWYYNYIVSYHIILYYIILYYVIALNYIIVHTFHYTHCTYLHTTVHHDTYNTARCLSQPQVFRYVKSTAENSFWAYGTVCFQSLDVRSPRWKNILISSTWDVGILGKVSKASHFTSFHRRSNCEDAIGLSPCLLVLIILLLGKFENHTWQQLRF